MIHPCWDRKIEIKFRALKLIVHAFWINLGIRHFTLCGLYNHCLKVIDNQIVVLQRVISKHMFEYISRNIFHFTCILVKYRSKPFWHCYLMLIIIFTKQFMRVKFFFENYKSNLNKIYPCDSWIKILLIIYLVLLLLWNDLYYLLCLK